MRSSNNSLLGQGCAINLAFHIAVCCLPPNFYSLLKQEFTDSLSTVLTSLLVNPDRCVLIIGDCNDHSAFKPCQLQSNLFRTYHHLTINNYCYDY